MEKHPLREDKTCQNCFHVVEKKYCTNCGQENTETRKTFGHLFTHFVEDFTHYDTAFWKTIKYLLFQPGRLTREFLSGKRKRFVPPVKLYIFINFLTFFLLSVLPSNPEEEVVKVNESEQKQQYGTYKSEDYGDGLVFGDYNSVRELDSLELLKPESERLSSVEIWLSRKFAEVREKNTPVEIKEKFFQSFISNLPKVLFLYMPFFALGLWLFHNKKRWYYFDHGIFTLHYFSFMLLTLSFYSVLESIASYLGHAVYYGVVILFFLVMIWWFFYFFRSHRRFYGESRLISRLKGLALFVINLFFIIIFLVGAMLYTALNIR